MYMKFLQIEKAEGEEPNQVTFTASTNTPDRYGDVVEQRGWNLAAYEKNPIILLNHDHSSLPIGKGIVGFKEGNLVVEVTFDMEDPLAANVARKAKNGFINAVSVGFQPIEAVSRKSLPEESPYYGKRGQYFKKAELLEVSIVTIPANSEATMLGKKLDPSIEQVLKDFIKEEISSILPVQNKHIVNIEESEEEVIVTFAKVKEEEVEEEILDLDDDEDTEEMYYEDDEKEEDEEKSYLDYISSYIATII